MSGLLGVEKLFIFDHTFSLSSVSRTNIKINRAGGKAGGPVLPAPLPEAAVGSSCLGVGARSALLGTWETLSRGGGGGGVAESHPQTLHPKEEQHASPGGHLFSQVCSPNVIKIGAALVHQRCGCRGTGVRRVEQLWRFGADGADDESLTERSGGEREVMEEGVLVWEKFIWLISLQTTV